MPDYLFIPANVAFERACGALAPELLHNVVTLSAPPSALLQERQGIAIIGEETHMHAGARGIIQAEDGDRLLLTADVVTQLDSVPVEVEALVVDGQVQPVDDQQALAEALFAAGYLSFGPEGETIVNPDPIQAQDTPPASAPGDSGGSGAVVDDTPIAPGGTQEETTLPDQGCETWQDVAYDPNTGEMVPAYYHSLGNGQYEVFF
jgi:hypothetical protein